MATLLLCGQCETVPHIDLDHEYALVHCQLVVQSLQSHRVYGVVTEIVKIFLEGILCFFPVLYLTLLQLLPLSSNSTVSEEAGIEPRTVATSALSVRRSNH